MAELKYSKLKFVTIKFKKTQVSVPNTLRMKTYLQNLCFQGLAHQCADYLGLVG